MSRPAELVSDQLRRHLTDAGSSAYSIAADAGIGRASLSRFLSGDRTLSLHTVDRIAAVLGLRLIATGRRPRPAAGKAD